MTVSSNMAVYADPGVYDLEAGEFKADGSILLALARAAPGPVLELGCGTGRVTIPLAEEGLDMTGLELLPHMLERARQKAADLPIQWLVADVRDFQLARRYSLIFTAGAIIQHLLERDGHEAMLARVREHLAPGGRFVIDASYKSPDKMIDVDEPVHWYTFTDKQGREVEVNGTDHYDHLRQLWTQTLYRGWSDGVEGEEVTPVAIRVRYFLPQELENLLHYNGFQVLARYGDWSGSPLTGDTFTQIYVCGLR